MKKLKIFIACDTTSLAKVKKIINQSKTNKIKIGYKFGLEFMNSKKGRQFVSLLKNKIIFVDLKLNDTVNTMLSAVKALKDLKSSNDSSKILFSPGNPSGKDFQNFSERGQYFKNKVLKYFGE